MNNINRPRAFIPIALIACLLLDPTAQAGIPCNGPDFAGTGCEITQVVPTGSLICTASASGCPIGSLPRIDGYSTSGSPSHVVIDDDGVPYVVRSGAICCGNGDLVKVIPGVGGTILSYGIEPVGLAFDPVSQKFYTAERHGTPKAILSFLKDELGPVLPTVFVPFSTSINPVGGVVADAAGDIFFLHKNVSSLGIDARILEAIPPASVVGVTGGAFLGRFPAGITMDGEDFIVVGVCTTADPFVVGCAGDGFGYVARVPPGGPRTAIIIPDAEGLLGGAYFKPTGNPAVTPDGQIVVTATTVSVTSSYVLLLTPGATPGAATASTIHSGFPFISLSGAAMTLDGQDILVVDATGTLFRISGVFVDDSDGDGIADGNDLCAGTPAGDTVDANGCSDAQVDGDGDGICTAGSPSIGPSTCTGSDNCPIDANPGQENLDGDADGDACDDDDDNDSVLDVDDNCPVDPNPDQTDNDGDGDACDDDDDNDSVLDGSDNCPLVANTDQSDVDSDGLGDACDTDLDGDGILNDADNCPAVSNVNQTDTDGDLLGDACDLDDDNDGILDVDDNCSTVVNPDQDDLDEDTIGDVCDSDMDGDGVNNDVDNCPIDSNVGQDDTDGDLLGDACDPDDDGDGVLDGADNCPLMINPDQADDDLDGRGNVCDNDLDGDGVGNDVDNCPITANSSQSDFDVDGIGDVCDDDIDGDGVNNGDDICANTPLVDTVHPDSGCSIEQQAPCEGPRGTTMSWKNHGKYVSAVAHAANDLVELGLMSEAQKDAIMTATAGSSCGSKKK